MKCVIIKFFESWIREHSINIAHFRTGVKGPDKPVT